MTFYIYLFGIVCVIGGVFFFISSDKNSKKETINTMEFTNVADIQDDSIQTGDGYFHSLIKIHPITIELYSDVELMDRVNRLSSELARERQDFKFCSIPQNVDVKPQINRLNKLRKEQNNPANKYFLRKSMEYLGEIATNSTSSESLFFYVLWDKNQRDLQRRTTEFIQYFERSGLSAEKMTGDEVAQVMRYYASPSLIDFSLNDEPRQTSIIDAFIHEEPARRIQDEEK